MGGGRRGNERMDRVHNLSLTDSWFSGDSQVTPELEAQFGMRPRRAAGKGGGSGWLRVARRFLCGPRFASTCIQ